MADLTSPTPAEVKVVQSIEEYTLPAGEVINAGDVVSIETTNGTFILADADSVPVLVAKGIAITSASAAGVTITAIFKGIVYLGAVLDALDFLDGVFPSATPGNMGDATVGAQPAIGEVVPGWGQTTPDKLLRVLG